MDETQIIEFLLAHREDLGKKLQNSPERWFFKKDILPLEVQKYVPAHLAGFLLAEAIDDTWYIGMFGASK